MFIPTLCLGHAGRFIPDRPLAQERMGLLVTECWRPRQALSTAIRQHPPYTKQSTDRWVVHALGSTGLQRRLGCSQAVQLGAHIGHAAGGGMNARASVLVATNRVVAQVGGVCGLTVKGQLPRGGRWLGMLDGRRGLSVPADPLLRPGSVSSGWGRGAGRSAADGSLKVWSQWVRVRRVPESAEKVVKAIPM